MHACVYLTLCLRHASSWCQICSFLLLDVAIDVIIVLHAVTLSLYNSVRLPCDETEYLLPYVYVIHNLYSLIPCSSHVSEGYTHDLVCILYIYSFFGSFLLQFTHAHCQA